MATVGETRKIMTKPLPEILDEIEDSIRLADEAAKNAREAALEARKAGDKAVEEATKNVSKRIVKIEETLAKIEQEICAIEANHAKAIAAANSRIEKLEESIRETNLYVVRVENAGNQTLQFAELLKSAVVEGISAIDRKITEKPADTKTQAKPESKPVQKTR